MKISTKARYGTIALIDLALHSRAQLVQLKDISQRQEISFSYLEHLFIPLIAAGIIKSTRGSRGGASLAKRPEDITLREIVEILEGPVSLVKCLDESDQCSRAGNCATRDVWEELTGIITDYLENTTLADLAERQKGKEKVKVASYDI